MGPVTSLSYDEIQRRTADAFDDPQPGDRFHEMYSWWVYVVARDGDNVSTLSAAAPCTFPDDGTLWTGSVQDLRERYSYASDPTHQRLGYTVLLASRGDGVDGWADRAARVERAQT